MKNPHAITTMDDLYNYFGSYDSFQSLNHRIYKDTACGASISVYGKVGRKPVMFHNGFRDPLPGNFKLESFTIQTIVEGSAATDVNSDHFIVGKATSEDIEHWIQEMESQADELWGEANNSYFTFYLAGDPKEGKFVAVQSCDEPKHDLSCVWACRAYDEHDALKLAKEADSEGWFTRHGKECGEFEVTFLYEECDGSLIC